MTRTASIDRTSSPLYVQPARVGSITTDARFRRPSTTPAGTTGGRSPRHHVVVRRAPLLGGVLNERRRGSHGGGDVTVRGVQQRPADDEPANGWFGSAASHTANVTAGSGPGAPPRSSSGWVVIDATVAMSAVAWIFNQVYADDTPRPRRRRPP